MNTSTNYAVCSLTFQMLLLSGLHFINISVTCPDHVLLFIRIYIPAMIVVTYILLVVMETKKRNKQTDFSKVMALLYSLFATFIGSCICHVIAVLLGATFIENFEETFSFASLLSALSVFPLFALHDGKWEEALNSFTLEWEFIDCLPDSIKLVSIFTCMGAWLGAIPIPLDWDRDWQTWPITCCAGAILANLIGCLSVIFLNSKWCHILIPNKKYT